MNKYTTEVREGKKQSVAKAASPKRRGSGIGFQLLDNRPKTIAQRKLLNTTNQSRQAVQFQGINEAVLQLAPTRITARYNQNPETDEYEGVLTGTLQSIANHDQAYFDTFPEDAYQAILNELNGLNPDDLEDGEQAYIDDIRRKVRAAGRGKVEFEGNENDSTATLGGATIGEVTYEQFEDGLYWVTGMYTNDDWQRLGIARQLIATAIDTIGGTLYASNQDQIAHEDRDDEDTRWLTEDGAALINAAIAAGLNVALANPFEEDSEENFEDDFEEDDAEDFEEH